ncbi:MAG: efflux RND transporter periplasmic adaptor subunit [Proteobacteria bacterium]|nr:efflux RND transporter periplasmic adaptor subunit [Pseudomonadota bacterium]
MPAALRPVAVLLLGGMLCACNQGHPTDEGQGAPAVPALRRQGQVIEVPPGSPLLAQLRVQAVAAAPWSTPITAPAAIEAAPEKLVKVVPPVAGRLVQIQRTLGDAVRAGDALFTMDSADMAALRAEQAKSQATLAQARREADRQKLLLDADIAARKDYEAAALALSNAQADAMAVADRLAQLGVPTAAGARGSYVMRAPISGRVVEMNGAQGAYWNDINAPVMTVADLSTVWLSAQVNERDLAGVAVGQEAHITLSAYPGQELRGKVRYVGELLDPQTRSVKLRVAVDNQGGRLRPGMFAQVRLDGPEHQALVLPATALLQSGVGTRVFVELSAGHFAAREVQVGAQQGDQVELTSGLHAGERVLVNGGVLLHD